MSEVKDGNGSAFLIRRAALPASPRAALRELQPRLEQSRFALAQTLRTLAKELEHEADELTAGTMRPAVHMVAPYAQMLDRMRAEANILREWTTMLRSEVRGPITPYMGVPVVPPQPHASAAVRVKTEAADAAGTAGSIAALMDQVASAHRG